jgi:hypothetical protein
MSTPLKPEAEIAEDILRNFAESEAGMGRSRTNGHMAQVLHGISLACSRSGLERILRPAMGRAKTAPYLQETQRPWVTQRLAAQLPSFPSGNLSWAAQSQADTGSPANQVIPTRSAGGTELRGSVREPV